jgi:hypothetical protein
MSAQMREELYFVKYFFRNPILAVHNTTHFDRREVLLAIAIQAPRPEN